MNSKQKVLVITYYWPPSGGAGVQRWLKITKYLSRQGFEVHVLTVDPKKGSFPHVDKSLLVDISPDVKVHYSNSFEPLKWYSRIVGKSNVPTAGYSNVDGQSWKQKLVSKLRSRLFIPDPRIGWKKYAYKKALTIIKDENISNVITTSPPHSVQLIGLKLKTTLKEKIRWLVDFRDPWTDIYYYPLLQHSKLSHQKNLNLERSVLETADEIVTVGEEYRNSFVSKTDLVTSSDIHIITNAYDSDDFKIRKETPPDPNTFLVSYIGTISEKYKADVFFEALGRLVTEFSDAPIQFVGTGVIAEKLQKLISTQLGDKAVFKTPVPHEEAVKAMLRSHVLLLITPGIEGIIPGKTFEYLASGRRIVAIGKGQNAKLIAQCQAGASFNRSDKDEIYNYLKSAFIDFQNGKRFQSNMDEVEKLSWEHNTRKIVDLLD